MHLASSLPLLVLSLLVLPPPPPLPLSYALLFLSPPPLSPGQLTSPETITAAITATPAEVGVQVDCASPAEAAAGGAVGEPLATSAPSEAQHRALLGLSHLLGRGGDAGGGAAAALSSGGAPAMLARLTAVKADGHALRYRPSTLHGAASLSSPGGPVRGPAKTGGCGSRFLSRRWLLLTAAALLAGCSARCL